MTDIRNLITIVEAASAPASKFPITTKALSDPKYAGTLERFLKGAEMLEAGVAAGGIQNVAFKSAKDYINRALEYAWRVAISEPYVYDGRWNELPEEVYRAIYDRFELHTIGAKEKKLAKAPAHAAIEAARALVAEIKPLAALAEQAKGMIIKRQPKPDAATERKAKYDAPRVEKTAVGIVKKILTEITDNAYAELVTYLTDRNNRIITRYIELLEKTKGLDYRQWRKSLDYEMQTNIERNYGSAFIYNAVNTKTRERAANADAIAAAAAVKLADDIREMFIYKNLDKIASILDAKGNFKSAKLIDRVILDGLEGTIHFTFEDSSSFVVKNSVVFVRNSQGTEFNRFPLIFTNVFMPDGSRMKNPSEEKMNKEFAKWR